MVCFSTFFYSYDEKYRSKATVKNILKHTILYVHCVDLLIWILTRILYFMIF